MTHGQGEECDKLLLILADAHTGDLCEALQCHISKHGHVQELKTGEADVSLKTVLVHLFELNRPTVHIRFGQLLHAM